MMEFLEGLDWSPLIISLKTGVVATIVCFFLGLFAARKVIKLSFKAKAVVDGILTLPMVFPPTVAGFILLLIFSRGVQNLVGNSQFVNVEFRRIILSLHY